MSVRAKSTFSLKDQLFNTQKVKKIAGEIAMVYPGFHETEFVQQVTNKLSERELMERLYWIRDCLREFLPDDYRTAVGILLRSLPAPCDPALFDNDFGDFIYGPYGAFVAEYGCTEKDLTFSLQALKQMTTRFSVEFPIRTFLNAFPAQTVQTLLDWTSDEHYHVRRLASEGTRPNLPWAKKILLDYQDPLPILDVLYSDQTRFVTRSVANHMNDISKLNVGLVVEKLKQWQQAGKQDVVEMDYIIRHSLRTLEKRGDRAALQLLGYAAAEIELSAVTINTRDVQIGDAVEFTFGITSTANTTQKLIVDYHLFFQKANGTLSPKTFKITKTSIAPGETIFFTKRQPLRPMTTRVLHPGVHEIELQINGKVYPRKKFTLHSS